MYQNTAKKLTASINSANEVVVMCDDGFENILSYRATFTTKAAAEAHLTEGGFTAYDPNAHLKAMGMVFINGCYRMPVA
jgi:hypothetical protein